MKRPFFTPLRLALIGIAAVFAIGAIAIAPLHGARGQDHDPFSRCGRTFQVAIYGIHSDGSGAGPVSGGDYDADRVYDLSCAASYATALAVAKVLGVVAILALTGAPIVLIRNRRKKRVRPARSVRPEGLGIIGVGAIVVFIAIAVIPLSGPSELSPDPHARCGAPAQIFVVGIATDASWSVPGGGGEYQTDSLLLMNCAESFSGSLAGGTLAAVVAVVALRRRKSMLNRTGRAETDSSEHPLPPEGT